MNNRFVDETSQLVIPQCYRCQHWNGDGTCKAFPAGVPNGILMNAIDHRHAVKGDHGITFKAKGQKDGPVDEPRDDHGRWTSGGGTSVAEKEPKAGIKEHIARIADEVKRSLGMEGYPVGVDVPKLNAKHPLQWDAKLQAEFDAAGSFVPAENGSGSVDIDFTHGISDYGLKRVLTHELSHARFHYADSRNDELQNFVSANAGALRKEDGTTTYSKEWWKEAADSPPTSRRGDYATGLQPTDRLNRFWTAVDESLAEMHAEGKLTPTYKKLDAIIAKHWKARGKQAVVYLKAGPEDEPRDDHGRWTSGGGGSDSNKPSPLGAPQGHMHDLLERVRQPDGGFTYHVFSDKEPKEGYALSLHPERSYVQDIDKLQFSDLVGYVAKNNDLLKQADNYLGAWHDPRSSKVYLDVSTITKDRGTAERLAREHKQIAYFDLKAGNSVDVSPSLRRGT